MANSITTNKAGINPVNSLRYIITGSDVVKYLQDQLGFTVMADFTRWTGITPDHSYVRMRVALASNDIVATNSSSDYVDRFLADHQAGILFKDTVVNTLKPFTFPEKIVDVYNRPDDLKALYERGIFNERLDEIVRHTKINYAPDAKAFRIYLRPERIITDMLSDPATNAVNGKLEIVAVYGTTSDTIRWEVAVSNTNNSFNGYDQIMSLDSIFNQV